MQSHGIFMKTMSVTPFSDDDLELWVLLQQARDAIFKARENELRDFNLSQVAAAVLELISIIGHRSTPAELSKWLVRKPNAVSTLLERMEKDGLVKRVKDLESKNLIRVERTERGHQLYNEAIKRESIHRAMSWLSEAERQQMRSILIKLRDAVCEDLGFKVKPILPQSLEKGSRPPFSALP